MQGKLNVLIVDDNASLSKTMSLVLARKGHVVGMAGDGLEAIEMAKQSHFDMVFMDVKMPEMDGVEAYRQIKKIRPEAVVVMMTAYGVDELVEQALQEGARGVLYKPLDMAKVLALIEGEKKL